MIPDEVLADTQTLLAYLTRDADKNWVKVMTDTLNESEREATHVTLGKLLAPLGRDVPYGAFAGGTGALKDVAQLEGESGQEAIKFLKTAGRLLQVGKGRGKCLLIINVDELGDEEIRQVAQKMIPERAKVPAKAKEAPASEAVEDEALTALFRAMERVVDEFSELKRENTELRTILEEFDKLKKATAWA